MKEIKTSQYLIRLYFNEKITDIPLHFTQITFKFTYHYILYSLNGVFKDKMELLKY